MLMLRQFGKEDFHGTIRWVKYFPCHSQAHATCLLSHLITQLSPWLWFKNISMRPAPLIWLAKGTIFFFVLFLDFIVIAWLHPCAALKDAVHWCSESKVKLRGGQSPGNEHPQTLL